MLASGSEMLPVFGFLPVMCPPFLRLIFVPPRFTLQPVIFPFAPKPHIVQTGNNHQARLGMPRELFSAIRFPFSSQPCFFPSSFSEYARNQAGDSRLF